MKAESSQYQLKPLFLCIKTWEVVWSIPGATAGCPRRAAGEPGLKTPVYLDPRHPCRMCPPSPSFLLLTALLKALCSPNAILCKNCWCCDRAVHHTLRTKFLLAWDGAMRCLQGLAGVTASHSFSELPVVDPVTHVFLK